REVVEVFPLEFGERGKRGHGERRIQRERLVSSEEGVATDRAAEPRNPRCQGGLTVYLHRQCKKIVSRLLEQLLNRTDVTMKPRALVEKFLRYRVLLGCAHPKRPVVDDAGAPLLRSRVR